MVLRGRRCLRKGPGIGTGRFSGTNHCSRASHADDSSRTTVRDWPWSSPGCGVGEDVKLKSWQ